MPDGRSIVLHAARRPDADNTLYPEDIWRFPLDGRAPVQLTKENGTETNPTVSPDGRYNAFLGFADKGHSNHNFNLYVVNADGSGLRQLARELDRNISSPRWEANSRGLLAIVETSTQADLPGVIEVHILRPDGAPMTTVLGTGTPPTPDEESLADLARGNTRSTYTPRSGAAPPRLQVVTPLRNEARDDLLGVVVFVLDATGLEGEYARLDAKVTRQALLAFAMSRSLWTSSSWAVEPASVPSASAMTAPSASSPRSRTPTSIRAIRRQPSVSRSWPRPTTS